MMSYLSLMMTYDDDISDIMDAYFGFHCRIARFGLNGNTHIRPTSLNDLFGEIKVHLKKIQTKIVAPKRRRDADDEKPSHLAPWNRNQYGLGYLCLNEFIRSKMRSPQRSYSSTVPLFLGYFNPIPFADIPQREAMRNNSKRILGSFIQAVKNEVNLGDLGSLSFDSTTHKGIKIATIAAFKDGSQIPVYLRTRRIVSEKTRHGRNWILGVLRDWSISLKQVVYVTCDAASSNRAIWNSVGEHLSVTVITVPCLLHCIDRCCSVGCRESGVDTSKIRLISKFFRRVSISKISVVAKMVNVKPSVLRVPKPCHRFMSMFTSAAYILNHRVVLTKACEIMVNDPGLCESRTFVA